LNQVSTDLPACDTNTSHSFLTSSFANATSFRPLQNAFK
jgi:hypothetical protein